MDVGFISLESVDVAIMLVKEAQAVCAKGKVTPSKINFQQSRGNGVYTESVVEVKKVDLNYNDLATQRVLGVKWNVESDTFSFKV